MFRAEPPGELQFRSGPHRLDLTWGHPDPTLLPVDELRAATDAAIGWRSLSYGAALGSGRLRTVLAERLGTAPDELVVTNGSSGALDLLLHVASRPGDVVLVEQPTYFLALRIIADRGLRAVGLPPGADPADALEECPTGRRMFLYLCPTHANPTGRTLTDDRRRALVDVAARRNITIIEDDVYSELGFETVPPVWTLAPDRVVRLGSFSKTLAPGLRLGFLRAPRETAGAIADCGVLDSGGGANPLLAAAVAGMIETGAYDTVVDRLRTSYAERMSALLSGVDEAHLPAGRPTGGYFAWLRADHDDLVGAAAAEGLAVSPAALFHVDPVDGRCARVSCSLLGPDDLADASARLHRALRL